MKPRTHLRSLILVAVLAGSTGCGGGSGPSAVTPPPPPPPPPPSVDWTPGVFEPSSHFAAQCAMPRTGINPVTKQPYPDQQASELMEVMWMRSWTNELYLWYQEVRDENPLIYANLKLLYFDTLRTFELEPSGELRDRFHFTLPTAEWEALAQSGVAVGFGVQWAVLSPLPPREAAVAYVEPGSPAAVAGIARGARLLAVDGVDINDDTEAGLAILNAGLTADTLGEVHTLTIRDLGAANSRDVTLQAREVTSDPVQSVTTIDTPSGKVGYMLFNDHLASSEAELVNAFTGLQNAGVSDLVLDIRYNSGGFVDIASEVAYMIAGPDRTTGKTFELPQFNDKHPTINPVTGEPITPVRFHSEALGLSAPEGQALPFLNLGRVFVLTGANTCSASESIMNGLRGIGVEVIQIGLRTCGKPYGFYPTDNCGTTYFSIQLRAVNAQGEGEYSDGFAPQNMPGIRGMRIPGCSVADDLDHAFADPLEARLAAALEYRETSTCPDPAGEPSLSRSGAQSAQATAEPRDVLMFKSPGLANRILRR